MHVPARYGRDSWYCNPELLFFVSRPHPSTRHCACQSCHDYNEREIITGIIIITGIVVHMLGTLPVWCHLFSQRRLDTLPVWCLHLSWPVHMLDTLQVQSHLFSSQHKQDTLLVVYLSFVCTVGRYLDPRKLLQALFDYLWDHKSCCMHIIQCHSNNKQLLIRYIILLWCMLVL